MVVWRAPIHARSKTLVLAALTVGLCSCGPVPPSDPADAAADSGAASEAVSDAAWLREGGPPDGPLDAAPIPDTHAAHDVLPPLDSSAVDVAPPSNDGGFFGASRCTAGQFLFCDDFEGQTIDAERWSYNGDSPSSGKGYATIDSTRAARGHHSLHMHTELNKMGSGSQLHSRQPQPALGNGFYLRAFMYFAQPIPDHHLNYFSVIDATPQSGGMFSLGSLDGKLGMVEFGPHNGDQAVTADPLVVGRWLCVEWQVAPATNELRVWLDEVDVPALHVTDWSPSRWKELLLELISFQGAYDLWIDELAYDSQRIGCQR